MVAMTITITPFRQHVIVGMNTPIPLLEGSGGHGHYNLLKTRCQGGNGQTRASSRTGRDGKTDRIKPFLGKKEMTVMTIPSPIWNKNEIVAVVIPYPRLEQEEVGAPQGPRSLADLPDFSDVVLPLSR